MAKLGMGVVGVGTMGKRHAENIRRLIPEARLIAVADRRPYLLKPKRCIDSLRFALLLSQAPPYSGRVSSPDRVPDRPPT